MYIIYVLHIYLRVCERRGKKNGIVALTAGTALEISYSNIARRGDVARQFAVHPSTVARLWDMA